MKSADVVKLLNLHDSTLRRYALHYGDYLSPAGAGGTGHHRDYTEQDVRILKLIRDMKNDREVKPGDIEATLSSLAASHWDRLPALSETNQSIVPTQDNMIALRSDNDRLQGKIEGLEDEINRLYVALGQQRADRDELLQRVQRAELMLELYQQGKLKPE